MKEFIPLIIEAVVFLIPILSIFIKLGGYKKVLEDIEDYKTFKTDTANRLDFLEKNDNKQAELLDSINRSLIDISTKVTLLLDNKIKVE